MILVVDCNLKDIKVWAFSGKDKSPHGRIIAHVLDDAGDDGALLKSIEAIAGKENIEAISFRVLFGGDNFHKPVLVGQSLFKEFEKLTDFFPFYVPVTLQMLKRFRRIFKDMPLIAFFESSFFLKLPDEEKYYALPFEYHKNNRIRKWGFHGIFHEANSELSGQGGKNISIVFDKQTTVCATLNKQPLSISLGYTPLEGVMSRTSCGDLDPGIVFYLMNVQKFSIYEIDDMLKRKSGFVGLTGYDIELKDMLKLHGRDPKVDLAFDVYEAQIMKYIGEGISVLGGLDSIVFSGGNVDIFTPIIHDIIKKISFLGINTVKLPWRDAEEVTNISRDESRIKVYINKMDLAKVIFDKSEIFLRLALSEKRV